MGWIQLMLVKHWLKIFHFIMPHVEILINQTKMYEMNSAQLQGDNRAVITNTYTILSQFSERFDLSDQHFKSYVFVHFHKNILMKLLNLILSNKTV